MVCSIRMMSRLVGSGPWESETRSQSSIACACSAVADDTLSTLLFCPVLWSVIKWKTHQELSLFSSVCLGTQLSNCPDSTMTQVYVALRRRNDFSAWLQWEHVALDRGRRVFKEIHRYCVPYPLDSGARKMRELKGLNKYPCSENVTARLMNEISQIPRSIQISRLS